MGELSKEYGEGYEAARNGIADSSCPYPIDSTEESEWVTGWINYHRDNPPPAPKKGGCGCGGK